MNIADKRLRWAMLSLSALMAVQMTCFPIHRDLRPAEAQNPLKRLFSRETVEAEEGKEYLLTDTSGPWMIMTCSFSGPTARQEANALVLELRKRYKLKAYLYHKTFIHKVGDAGRGIDELGGKIKRKYAKEGEHKEYAVLVGDFIAVDDPALQKALEKIKNSHPECLKLDKNKKTSRNLAFWRIMTDDDGNAGPLEKAFATTNPILPKDYFNQEGVVDDFVAKLNKDSEYNLLKCPGKYTVQVAFFTGYSKVAAKKDDIQEMMNEDIQDIAKKSSLVEAGIKATKLTKALRQKGYEAYEFHDRYASLVTVGSFNSIGQKQPDGKTELRPEIANIFNTFKAEQVGPVEGRPDGAFKPKSLVGIMFDASPRIIVVPRKKSGVGMAQKPSPIKSLW